MSNNITNTIKEITSRSDIYIKDNISSVQLLDCASIDNETGNINFWFADHKKEDFPDDPSITVSREELIEEKEEVLTWQEL